MLLLIKSYWEKTHEKSLLVSPVCGWYNYIKIENKDIGSNSFHWICLDLDAGCWQICNSVVERMFFVSGECLDKLMDCDTVTQYCSAVYCVGVWQAVQT
jgi:hypothetical protein